MKQAREAQVSHTPTTTHTGAGQVSTRAPTETQTTPASPKLPIPGAMKQAREAQVSTRAPAETQTTPAARYAPF